MSVAIQAIDDMAKDTLRAMRPLLIGDWIDDMREIVERRIGVSLDVELDVLGDPAYVAVLNAYSALVNARQTFENAVGQVARAIESVERSAR